MNIGVLLNIFYFVLLILTGQLLLTKDFTPNKKIPLWAKNVITLSGVGLIVLVSALSEMLVYNEGGSVYYNILFYTVLFAIAVGLYRLWLEVSLNRWLLVSISSYALQHLAYRFSWYIIEYAYVACGWYETINTAELYALFAYAVQTLTYIAVFCLNYFTYLRKIKKYRCHCLNMRRVLLVSIVLLLIVIVLNTIATKFTNFYTYPLVAVLSAISILSCTMLMFLIVSYLETANLVQQNTEQTKYYQDQIKQYESAKENVELINIKCHDLRKQMSLLRADKPANEKEMKEIEDSIRIYDSTIITESAPLNIVLSEASLRLKKDDVTFTTLLDGKLLSFMDDVDVFSLFGNILDNALEAVKKIPDVKKRIITLTLKEEQGFVAIECLNYYDGTIIEKDKKLKTTKPDKDNHGYGTKSILLTAKKYGGEASFRYDKETFRVRVLLPKK